MERSKDDAAAEADTTDQGDSEATVLMTTGQAEMSAKPATFRVLLVEDSDADAHLIRTLAQRVKTEETQVTTCQTLNAATALGDIDFDVILTDLNLPDAGGPDTVVTLVDSYPHVPVIALTVDEQLGLQCIEAGAQDFIPKPELNLALLRRSIAFSTQRAAAAKRASDLSGHDPLTGLLNRRAFESGADKVLSSRADQDAGVIAMFIDVNDFKEINDRYGHSAGDQILVEVAKKLSASVRSDDLVSRWGGDEFAVIGRSVSQRTFDELRTRVRQNLRFTVTVTDLSGEEQSVPLTSSVGVIWVPADDHRDLAQLMADADADMYDQKRLSA